MEMTRRRFAARLVSVAALVAVPGAHAQSQSTTDLPQADYIFWLSAADRDAIGKAATELAVQFDALAGNADGIANSVYRSGSERLRDRYGLERFKARLLNVRNTLGRTSERVFQGIDGGFKFLPNLKEGHYAIALFDVRSADGETIFTEQFTLSKEGSRWLFVEYYVDSKPYYSF